MAWFICIVMRCLSVKCTWTSILVSCQHVVKSNHLWYSLVDLDSLGQDALVHNLAHHLCTFPPLPDSS